MTFQLPKLPYEKNALAPFLTEETFNFHYGKHHNAYITKLNTIMVDTPYATMSLEEMMPRSLKDGRKDIFNNAAQAWNHTFFWYCMAPKGKATLGQEMKTLIERDFGSWDAFCQKFETTGAGQFGSGWVWLVRDAQGKMSVESTSNAEVPFTSDPTKVPLLVADVWEHAYYIDYRNERPRFLKSFWDCVNWNFVHEQYRNNKLFNASALMK